MGWKMEGWGKAFLCGGPEMGLTIVEQSILIFEGPNHHRFYEGGKGAGDWLLPRLFAVVGVVGGGFPDRTGDCADHFAGALAGAGAALCGVAGCGGAPHRGLCGPLCWRIRGGGCGFVRSGWVWRSAAQRTVRTTLLAHLRGRVLLCAEWLGVADRRTEDCADHFAGALARAVGIFFAAGWEEALQPGRLCY